jgi:thiamine-monophosphate kinase
MDERAALRMLADRLPPAGDDAAVVDGVTLTIDMLHASADFPPGTTPYTIGWRSVAASLSDLAAMGADATAAVAVYAAPDFVPDELESFVDGATDVCETVGARYVGGDLDHHDELTVVASAIGRCEAPVLRSGANPGDLVCVTGSLGRSAAALRRFEAGDVETGNDLFRFEPRVAAGQAIAVAATALMDSSDGLARSLHQLADASNCGFAVDAAAIPIDDAVHAVADDADDALELATTVGEDFELVFTIDPAAIDRVREQISIPVAVIGDVTTGDVTIDGSTLADEGYTHG